MVYTLINQRGTTSLGRNIKQFKKNQSLNSNHAAVKNTDINKDTDRTTCQKTLK